MARSELYGVAVRGESGWTWHIYQDDSRQGFTPEIDTGYAMTRCGVQRAIKQAIKRHRRTIDRRESFTIRESDLG